MMQRAEFDPNALVDFVIVGSGAAGGVVAKELAAAGFRVVVLEQGPYRRAADFKHDELGEIFNQEMIGGRPMTDPQTFRRSEAEGAEVRDAPPPVLYARTVGGSSVHFTGNYWRFHEIDFLERSLLGSVPGTGLADWPIPYAELEPYYTKVDWEIGVSGVPGPFDPVRSAPYPVPPLPVKSSGVLFEKGARALGLHPQPAPMAILSQPHNGRPACAHCGFCMLFGCEMNAKSSSLSAMIPLAEATGRCEIRTESTVHRIELDAAGRVSHVLYFDREGVERRQRTKALVLSANGAETARLLLMSASPRFPDGLANSSGLVGKYLMFNAHSMVYGQFERPIDDYKSVQVTRLVHDFYDSDPKRGFYGGGGIDARSFTAAYPIWFALEGMPLDGPSWGAEFKRSLAELFTHTFALNGHTTSLPLETNSISLDPDVKDRFGRPAIRVTYRDHPDDLATARFLQERSVEILEAAGARKIWRMPVEESTVGAHLLGTCRMGTDPSLSVVDPTHRTHDVPNLFIVDGSSFVTSGRGQPTMTIQALAFRAAEHVMEFARRGEI